MKARPKGPSYFFSVVSDFFFFFFFSFLVVVSCAKLTVAAPVRKVRANAKIPNLFMLKTPLLYYMRKNPILFRILLYLNH